jgi:hypothetical protein
MYRADESEIREGARKKRAECRGYEEKFMKDEGEGREESRREVFLIQFSINRQDVLEDALEVLSGVI